MTTTAREEAASIATWIASHGVALPDGFSDRIERFRELVLEANERVNLTRITAPGDFFRKHVADSLLLALALPAIQTSTLELLDVGCGAGIPGIPLALAFPSLSITEVDSMAKKVQEVEWIIRSLGLERARALHARARELAHRKEHQERYDLVVARAVTDTAILIRECRRLLRPGGALVTYKTPAQAAQEIPLVTREAEKFHLDAAISASWHLPENAGERVFWLIARPA